MQWPSRKTRTSLLTAARTRRFLSTAQAARCLQGVLPPALCPDVRRACWTHRVRRHHGKTTRRLLGGHLARATSRELELPIRTATRARSACVSRQRRLPLLLPTSPHSLQGSRLANSFSRVVSASAWTQVRVRRGVTRGRVWSRPVAQRNGSARSGPAWSAPVCTGAHRTNGRHHAQAAFCEQGTRRHRARRALVLLRRRRARRRPHTLATNAPVLRHRACEVVRT